MQSQRNGAKLNVTQRDIRGTRVCAMPKRLYTRDRTISQLWLGCQEMTKRTLGVATCDRDARSPGDVFRSMETYV